MTSTTNISAPIHQNVIPSEVGWQFVPQYYTYVNQQPNRLHRFYTKASTFIHGVEGEDGKPCYGQQEIHNKITSIGFQDCKVFIHSVDAQSSANGGIIIQVIGEMSNRGEDWRKFVQTFFLAEQPNGYFVLNDIFRFLKEETVESDEASEGVPEPAPAPQQPEPLAPTPAAEPEPEPQPPALPPVPEEPPKTVIPEPAPATPAPEPAPAQVNGVHSPAPAEPEQPQHEPPAATPSPAPEPEPESVPTTVSPPPVSPPQQQPPPLQPPPPQQQPPSSSPSPAAVSAPVQQAPAPPQPQPQPTAPPQPKTWANLAAANSKKWGSAVAQESRGTSEVPVTPVSVAPPTRTTSQGPTGPGRGPGQFQQQRPAVIAAQNIPTPQVFIKGVDNVSQNALTQVLTTRFGPVKEVEIVRSKACAFVEFNSIDAAKRALVVSLAPSLGGEGGVWVETESGGQTRIYIEQRKERGERPVSRPRMNGPGGAGPDMRGSFRGRGGLGGRGGRGGAGGPPK